MYGYPYGFSPCCPPPYPAPCRPGFFGGWLYGLVVILFILLLLGGGHWYKNKLYR
ncbi:hypothetical protein [Sutcliffiella rhizosphaerae]|uniref:hypothetical protein n=1 Tax=Sutcliffiella rhizosphaerae TaxID=2880967 RepID=UPI001E652247|nr:hypothetical protein [Sutcliffiella rhizosphaerae]